MLISAVMQKKCNICNNSEQTHSNFDRKQLVFQCTVKHELCSFLDFYTQIIIVCSHSPRTPGLQVT